MNQILALSGCKGYPEALAGSNEYVEWRWLADGILRLTPIRSNLTDLTGSTDSDHVSDALAFADTRVRRLLISTGIHGNETAPIEIVAQLVCQLLNGERFLALELLVVFGNMPAIEQDKRYFEVDLNRLFNGKHRNYPECAETRRAAEIEQVVEQFFVSQPSLAQHFHFDMHTAIRGSVHPRFGILPQHFATGDSEYLQWLRAMNLDAIVLNTVSSGTFSSFTSQRCNAISCTLELGKAQPFGANDLRCFSAIESTLIAVICGDTSAQLVMSDPEVYVVEKELTKLSDDYQFIAVADDVQNFTRYTQGTVLAVDGEVTYQVERDFEWIIFPNPSVRVGLRAGIMLRSAPVACLFDA
jgi:succinylglutamate desuccinylase